MTQQFIYKICAKKEWDTALEIGAYQGSTVDIKDGFIHFSTADQSAETAAKHFSGIHGLVLIRIDSKRLGSALKWEISRDGALFPHLYEPLSTALIDWVADLPIGDDGLHVFPALD